VAAVGAALPEHMIRLTEERQTVPLRLDASRRRAFQRRCGMNVVPSVLSRIAATKAILEQKFHLPVEWLFKGGETQGDVMTTLQAMCLGAMLAWTPSLVVLALLLHEAPLDELQHDPS